MPDLKLPVRAKIPDEHVSQGIHYLSLAEGDGGYYLFLWESLEGGPKWDHWNEDLQEFLRDCEDWGIGPDDWEPMENE